MAAESALERIRRESQRVLFDSIADLYEQTRSSYPDEILRFLIETAGIAPGDPVLEIGCGTGKLTRQLVAHGVALTAIDIGPSMIEVARRRVDSSDVRFVRTAFEDFEAPDRSFALVVSATAFHWLDPETVWTQISRLLRPTGWLAVLGTREHYDEPFGSALVALWASHNLTGTVPAADQNLTLADTMIGTGLFDLPVTRSAGERRTMGADTVFSLEQTRATTLSYDETTRSSFLGSLQGLLARSPTVELEQRTSLTMARSRTRR